MDLHSRRIISYRLDDHMGHKLFQNALKEAISLRQPKEGWINYSDRGAILFQCLFEYAGRSRCNYQYESKSNVLKQRLHGKFFGSLKRKVFI